jgi:CBS domain-containing protein
MMMKVSQAMTRDVRVASSDLTIQEAAQLMKELDIGVLPVGQKDRLVGVITDRDIAVRGVAEGRSPNAKVRDVMTTGVKYCFDDQEVAEISRNMGDIQVRRLPVVDRSKRLVGILSLGDIAVTGGDGKAGEALTKISQPGGEHGQSR